MQEQIKNAFKSNWRKIVRCFLEASIYCALYHHATEALKTRTKKRRQAPCVIPSCIKSSRMNIWSGQLNLGCRVVLTFMPYQLQAFESLLEAGELLRKVIACSLLQT